jgi:hypothetical protein
VNRTKPTHHLVCRIDLAAGDLLNRLFNHGLKSIQLLFIEINLLHIQIIPLIINDEVQRRAIRRRRGILIQDEAAVLEMRGEFGHTHSIAQTRSTRQRPAAPPLTSPAP